MVYNRRMAAAANRLGVLRRAADLTQKQLAEIVDVDGSMISRYESGQVSIPDQVKVALAARFGVSVSHLMGWDDDGNGNGDPSQRLVA